MVSASLEPDLYPRLDSRRQRLPFIINNLASFLANALARILESMTKKAIKKTKVGVKLPTGSYVLVSRTKDGTFKVGGTAQSQLVNKHPDIKVRRADIQPKKLTKAEISQMIKAMKVA